VKVFAYLAGISIGSAILFGLAPAVRLANTGVNHAIRNGGYGASGGAPGRRLSNILVAVEMTLCLVLLAGAGLMIRSSVNVYGAPIGVNPANVLTMRINLPQAKYPRAEDVVTFYGRLRLSIESLPGVDSAAAASSLPFSRPTGFSYQAEGSPAQGRAGGIMVDPDYFRVMQAPLLRGRLFGNADEVVVNHSFADRVWPGEDGIGKHLRVSDGEAEHPWLVVTGIAPDILQNAQHAVDHLPLIYLSFSDGPNDRCLSRREPAFRLTRWAKRFEARCRRSTKTFPPTRSFR
jgi:hypothetical protein